MISVTAKDEEEQTGKGIVGMRAEENVLTDRKGERK